MIGQNDLRKHTQEIDMSVTFTPKANQAEIQICGEVNQATALLLREALREAREYWHYDHLVLQINSPGGELLALKALMHEARWWRQRGGTLATEALLQAGSAAALALSLGDVGHRSVQPYTELLYHHTRLLAAGEFHLTAHHAEAAQRRLRQVDHELLHTLVGHIADGFGGVEALARAGVERCRKLSASADVVAQALGRAAGLCGQGRRTSKDPASLMLKRMESVYQKVLAKHSPEPMIGLLADIFERDAPMPVDVAWGLLLIDAVDTVEALQPANRLQNQAKEVAQERSASTHRLAA